MKLRSFRRLAVASSFLIATGCTGADEPKLAEAPASGQTIFDYDPESNGAKDYLAVAREIIAQEKRLAKVA